MGLAEAVIVIVMLVLQVVLRLVPLPTAVRETAELSVTPMTTVQTILVLTHLMIIAVATNLWSMIQIVFRTLPQCLTPVLIPARAIVPALIVP